MKRLLVIVLMFFSCSVYSQVEVNASNLREHIGDSVKYCGRVVAARLMDRMKNAPVSQSRWQLPEAGTHRCDLER